MIKAENLSFSYTGTRPFLLDNINLSIAAGEYVSILGDNGSGKSTLMRLMLNFLKPTQGTIVIQARCLGYVPQQNDFTNSGFPITVGEMLYSYRKLLKVKDRGAAAESLRQVGLSGMDTALMGHLSGGQRQKALIARALMGSPELLLLDEPSTGVDPESQREIYGLLKRLNEDQGITIVSIEHNLAAAMANSTLIYHLAGARGHICTPEHYAEEYLNGQGRRGLNV